MKKYPLYILLALIVSTLAGFIALSAYTVHIPQTDIVKDLPQEAPLEKNSSNGLQ